ncbi:hypothetical protein DIY18_01160 [Streptococcus iniae]|uniref:hypothetical protein n=1 Tax=Streptococcus iniae TaxID=1346 RepID=UPI000B7886C3|nr:hypothetical protein [Streptococcus iniae]RLU35159.1 hypothetical protein DIY21_01105 [Streptococcus iniae]RLU38815.1 hypothetical protein DIY22_01220 [Streptococcus iniae]RLU40226.1 hypothetical protein DIY19_01215 [Streptococcus iniae]RLU40909.1 hypothetical protein DIY20_01095 [Streptococcus iniae]RLU47583.1 hypothetical protein DIY18_01160 [Streptococcus iniae]
MFGAERSIINGIDELAFSFIRLGKVDEVMCHMVTWVREEENMRTILRFLVIISISGIILFVIGNVYNLSLKKNLILIFWSFLFELQVFIFTCKQTKEILTRQEWFKQIVLFFKSTIMVPVLIILIIVKEILILSIILCKHESRIFEY